jgi:hypothetical protein
MNSYLLITYRDFDILKTILEGSFSQQHYVPATHTNAFELIFFEIRMKQDVRRWRMPGFAESVKNRPPIPS